MVELLGKRLERKRMLRDYLSSLPAGEEVSKQVHSSPAVRRLFTSPQAGAGVDAGLEAQEQV